MEEAASDNRMHMAAIGKEYQEMVNQLITVGRIRRTYCRELWKRGGYSIFSINGTF